MSAVRLGGGGGGGSSRYKLFSQEAGREGEKQGVAGG